MGGLSIGHWLILLVVVVLIFGTKKLGNIGEDLGNAIRSFKEGMKEKPASKTPENPPKQQVINGEFETGAGEKIEHEINKK